MSRMIEVYRFNPETNKVSFWCSYPKRVWLRTINSDGSSSWYSRERTEEEQKELRNDISQLEKTDITPRKLKRLFL